MTSPGLAKDIVLVDVADGVMTITLNRPGVRSSADAREGASAFAEKRPPQWRGK